MTNWHTAKSDKMKHLNADSKKLVYDIRVQFPCVVVDVRLFEAIIAIL